MAVVASITLIDSELPPKWTEKSPAGIIFSKIGACSFNHALTGAGLIFLRRLLSIITHRRHCASCYGQYIGLVLKKIARTTVSQNGHMESFSVPSSRMSSAGFSPYRRCI